MKRLTMLILVVAAWLITPLTASAVGHGGTFAAKYVDGANVIILASNVHDTISGLPIEYNLRLFDMTGQPIPFDAAEIEIKRGSDTVEKRTVPISSNADITLKYEYGRQGTYTLYASFFHHNKQISRAEFPFVVTRGPNQSLLVSAFTVETGLAFLLGLSVMKLYTLRGQIITNIRKRRRAH